MLYNKPLSLTCTCRCRGGQTSAPTQVITPRFIAFRRPVADSFCQGSMPWRPHALHLVGHALFHLIALLDFGDF